MCRAVLYVWEGMKIILALAVMGMVSGCSPIYSQTKRTELFLRSEVMRDDFYQHTLHERKRYNELRDRIYALENKLEEILKDAQSREQRSNPYR